MWECKNHQCGADRHKAQVRPFVWVCTAVGGTLWVFLHSEPSLQLVWGSGSCVPAREVHRRLPTMEGGISLGSMPKLLCWSVVVGSAELFKSHKRRHAGGAINVTILLFQLLHPSLLSLCTNTGKAPLEINRRHPSPKQAGHYLAWPKEMKTTQQGAILGSVIKALPWTMYSANEERHLIGSG